jgi:hypothetical protein
MVAFLFVAVLAILGFLCLTGPETVLWAQGFVAESSP